LPWGPVERGYLPVAPSQETMFSGVIL